MASELRQNLPNVWFALELEAGFSANSYVGFVSWLFVGLGREVTHALCARQRTTRQHVQWSLRRGFVHKTILITKLLGPCFKDTSWRFATCTALYGRVQGQAGSDSEAQVDQVPLTNRLDFGQPRHPKQRHVRRSCSMSWCVWLLQKGEQPAMRQLPL